MMKKTELIDAPIISNIVRVCSEVDSNGQHALSVKNCSSSIIGAPRGTTVLDVNRENISINVIHETYTKGGSRPS